jgi:hypothetical protein
LALSNATIQKIQQAVKRFRAYLKFVNIGPYSISKEEIKDLVRAGYITEDTAIKSPIADAYLATHLHASDNPTGAPRTIREGAIKYLENMYELYSDKATDELGGDVVATLQSHLMPLIDRSEGEAVYEMLKDPDKHGKYLGNLLNDRVKNWSQRHKMIVQTETARAANWGSVDAILHNNKGKQPEEIVVYKMGTHSYEESCDVCKKFWFMPDGSPKLYTLNELFSGTSNIGRKKADLLPTIEPTHPHCVHLLHELKPGYGFRNRKLEYLGEAHSEIDKQRGNA